MRLLRDLGKDFFIQEIFNNYPIWNIDSGWKNQNPYFYRPQITFREVPDEISLTFPTLCYEPCSEDCNSKFCWKDNWKGKLNLLDYEVIEDFYSLSEEGISCITIMTSLCFPYLNQILGKFKKKHPNVKICIYLGKEWEELLPYKEFRNFDFKILDYIKIGRFYKELGPLNDSKTNQRLYQIYHLEKGELFHCINNKIK